MSTRRRITCVGGYHLGRPGAWRLPLACFGLFAIVAGMVAHQTQEIGVRMAVGATRGDVLLLVVRQGLAPAAAGLALGLIASTGANRLLSAQLVQIAPWDPLTLAAVAAILLLTTALGCLVPAGRATRVDPLTALRLD